MKAMVWPRARHEAPSADGLPSEADDAGGEPARSPSPAQPAAPPRRARGRDQRARVPGDDREVLRRRLLRSTCRSSGRTSRSCSGTAGGTKKLQDFWGGRDHPRHLGRRPPRRRRHRASRPSPAHGRARHAHRQAGRPTRARTASSSSTATRGCAGFQEKPTRDEARSDLANCGVYVIEPELLERIPADTFVDFGNDIWPSLVAANEEIYAYTTMAYWNDVGDLDELRNSILDAVLGHVRIEIPGKEVAPGCWAESGCRHRRRRPSSTARSSSAPTSSSRRTRRCAGRPRSARSASSARARPSAAPPSSRELRCRTKASRSRGSSATRRSSPTRCFGIPRATPRPREVTLSARSARLARAGDCYPTPRGG